MSLPREKGPVMAGIVVVTVAAWLYLLDGAQTMGGMARAWTATDLGYLLVMWSVMMAAMMLPSATPTILLFDRAARAKRSRKAGAGEDMQRVVRRTMGFVGGYLLVWVLYSGCAAVTQWLLHRLVLLSNTMVSVSPLLTGGLLLVAGVYQLTPLKKACLSQCRSPLQFLTGHWREGTIGALQMGIRHGAYCVGCCWALMALLFVLGVMNLFWVLALATIVLVEKTFPASAWTRRGVGLVLLLWGSWVLFGAPPTL